MPYTGPAAACMLTAMTHFFGVLKVIGDKKGGKATKFLINKQKVANEVLHEINLPIKLVHMVRNPYDNVATMTLRSLGIRTHDALAAENKVSYSVGFVLLA